MTRPQIASSIIARAKSRLAGVLKIAPTPNFGTAQSVAAFQTQTDAADALQTAYNTLLTRADAARNDLHQAEVKLATATNTMLDSVASTYGRDSNEYEAAGGVRTSARKKRARKAAPKPAPKTPAKAATATAAPTATAPGQPTQAPVIVPTATPPSTATKPTP